LEKIEMKKTLVAVAALATISGAMADVTIGGLLDAGVYSIGATTAAGAKTTTVGVGPQNNGTDELFFMATEDLDGGLKATARLGFNVSATTSAAGPTNRISYLGLAGSFGEVQVGEQWKPGFFTVLNADFTGLVATSGAGVVGPSAMVAYTANSITYNLPKIVDGLGFQYQKGYGEAAGNTGGNTSGYRVEYTNSGFYASYSAETAAMTAAGTFTGNTIGGTTDVLLATTALGTNLKSSFYNASYDFGMAKIGVGSGSSQAGATAKSTSTIYSLSAPVGSALVLAASVTSGQQVTSAAVATNTKGQRYAAFYTLSKRTSLYAFTGTSSAGSASRKTTETAAGIKHTF